MVVKIGPNRPVQPILIRHCVWFTYRKKKKKTLCLFGIERRGGDEK